MAAGSSPAKPLRLSLRSMHQGRSRPARPGSKPAQPDPAEDDVHSPDRFGRSRSHPPSDLVASDWAGFPRWGGELRACLTERTGFYDPYAAFAYPGVDRVRTSRPFGFAAAGA